MAKILSSFYFRWLLVGLVLRLLIMPFTFHWDLQTIGELASRFFSGGPQAFYTSSYATYPVPIFSLFVFFQIIFQPLLGQDFLVWLNKPVLTALFNPQIFKYLFLMKFPYLFFDLATAFLITLFFREERKKKLAFILWIFNPFTLHTTFAWGQFDIIPVFFTVLAFGLFLREKFLFSVLSLGLGGSFKLFPLLFLPIFLVLGEKSWFKRGALFLLGIFPWLASIIPFLGNPLFRQTNIASDQAQMLQHVAIPLGQDFYIHLFFPLYILLFLFALRAHQGRKDLVFSYSLIILLIFYAFSAFHPQWLLWGIPLFIWHLFNSPRTLSLYLILFLTYFLKLILDTEASLALFVPVIPELYELPQLTEKLSEILQFARLRAFLHSIFAGAAIFLILFLLSQEVRKKPNRPWAEKLLMKKNHSKAFFLVPIFFLSIGFNRLDINQEYRQSVLNLQMGTKIGQTFRAKHNNFNMIKLFAENVKLKNKDKIVFHLREIGNDNDLAMINLSGENIGTGFILRLQFEPIKNSAGKTFYFYLEDIEGKSSTPIEIYYEEKNVYPWGEALVNNESIAGDLFFRTYYRTSLKDGILDSLSDFKTRFIKEKNFAIFYLMSIFILGILSVTSFAKRRLSG